MSAKIRVSSLAWRLRRLCTWAELALGVRVVRCRPATARAKFAQGRRWYQEQFIDFDIPEGASVLDIGCGPFPFAEATMVCDLFEGETIHRRGDLRTDGKALIVADVADLPFDDKSFDFVYCSHVLEHVEDPITACSEIARVGKRGYVETPNFMKDALFCQAAGMSHRWHTIARGNTLFFFEYSEGQKNGIRTPAWSDLIWSPFHHPLQDAFVDHQDLFNTMLLWERSFSVVVVTNEGQILRSQTP